VRSTNPQVTHFLQMGLHGTNMKCLFIPKKGDEAGTGQVILNVGANDLKGLLEYAAAHPEAMRVPPLNFPLNLEGNGDKAGEPTRWENGGAVYAHAHLVSPAGPELYGRIGPWYAAALEGIWDLEWKQNLADRAVATVKQRVSPRQFQIFDAYVIKGWSVKKVMTELGVSMAQVYLAKHRVGGLIKKEIAELEKQLI
jgi:hypothetical protein